MRRRGKGIGSTLQDSRDVESGVYINNHNCSVVGDRNEGGHQFVYQRQVGAGQGQRC